MLELYHAGLTTCSKKARHGLKEKGVPYTSRYVRLDKFEHHTPEYLKINPNGIVPTLVHDGKSIIESCIINEYADEVFDGPRLQPEDPYLRARMRVFCKMADEYALPATRVPTWTRTKTDGLKAVDDAEFDKIIKETPLIDHQLKMKALRVGRLLRARFRGGLWPHAVLLRPGRGGAGGRALCGGRRRSRSATSPSCPISTRSAARGRT